MSPMRILMPPDGRTPFSPRCLPNGLTVQPHGGDAGELITTPRMLIFIPGGAAHGRDRYDNACSTAFRVE